MKILVLHGPNLNLLGSRDPQHYGNLTLAELNQLIQTEGAKLGAQVSIFQSNHEGVLIDRLHEFRGQVQGVVINPGALTHYSYALRDAIEGIRIPTVEVHLSDIHHREEFRKISVIAPVCIAQISGKGPLSYIEGLKRLMAQPSTATPSGGQNGGK